MKSNLFLVAEDNLNLIIVISPSLGKLQYTRDA